MMDVYDQAFLILILQVDEFNLEVSQSVRKKRKVISPLKFIQMQMASKASLINTFGQIKMFSATKCPFYLGRKYGFVDEYLQE